MDVVVVGSCNTDLVSVVPRLPRLGETLHGDSFAIGFGGKGANQCVMAARLGANSAMVAKVGDDTFGHSTVTNFKDNSVNAEHVTITKEAFSGVAPISVTNTGENSIVIVAGANLWLTEDDVNKAESMIASSKVVVCQFEICQEVTLAALKLARRHGVRTILNMAPAVPHLDSTYYENSDIICLNESEAELATGLPVQNVEDAGAAASVLLDRGCKTAIVTLGAIGSVFMTQENRQAIRVPAKSVDAVDTTGAGDAFIGALAYYLSKVPSLTLEEVVRRSNDIATTTVLAKGTQKSYPKRSELSVELFD